MKEVFAKPAAGAIIEATVHQQKCILIQERQKENGGLENGMLEIPAGKIREYENIYDALRREVWEETGLHLTEIQGEKDAVVCTVNGYKVISYQPYCSSQNLSGGYALIVQTFLAKAEGTLLEQTNETTHIRWITLEKCRDMIIKSPEAFYPMHLNTLRKYLFEQTC